MKLYYAPETCSLSPHIVLRELDLPFELVRVDNRSKRTEHGDDFLAINPKGYVAALQLDNGQVLTEGGAIVQFLADLKPDAGLAPANGSWQRVRLQEWLNFLGSEVHGTMGPLFNPAIPDEVKTIFRTRLFQRFALMENNLARRDYLLDDGFSVADIYLFTVMRWNRFFGIDLEPWPALGRFMARIGARPSVKAALAVELATQ
ncbi:glutathione transferase GstA [Pseudomonas gingeri]|uniref:Glutathione transferase GstA n=1 Tax=Pseudomonas gingeri TaxID=117681 RepID=A0A7Y8CNI9_9PSED|nr:glutathione transferase GstA [Pseudomonas gingeri]NWB28659.1 glutathione transferase GstA [Pseudomonas gingeri]NWC36094.1 glutathione transferase GstA [Pseudomonas gingeri]NWD06112.1 glutathione transferase GstA [Pseudomonas gingeri]NWD51962.1 glutathione transferase GstA [Pseudomonas gingeri]NWE32724.1 glutathione transferase GstA [Pseudomonas gingeri]